LIDGVSKFGNSWAKISATLLPSRTGKQCGERWEETLNPDVKTGPWTEEEVSGSALSYLVC
jgi:hypothetical protein